LGASCLVAAAAEGAEVFLVEGAALAVLVESFCSVAVEVLVDGAALAVLVAASFSATSLAFMALDSDVEGLLLVSRS